MSTPLEITFVDLRPSEAVRSLAERKARALDRYCRHIIRCRVAIARQHHRHRRGDLFSVHIRIEVPGCDVLVGHEEHDGHSHEDVDVAVRDAFDRARRRLEDYVRRHRHQVKAHADRPQGNVARLEGNYGFITTHEGREVYFHRNCVAHNGFDHLVVGDRVGFVEEPGDHGAQATVVHRLTQPIRGNARARAARDQAVAA